MNKLLSIQRSDLSKQVQENATYTETQKNPDQPTIKEKLQWYRTYICICSMNLCEASVRPLSSLLLVTSRLQMTPT